MTERERDSTRREGIDGRAVGRRTILGASLAGFAGAGFAGTAISQEDDLPNELVVVCLGERVEYAFEVDGQVEFGDDGGDRDEIQDGTTVTGRIEGRGRDNYHFSGNITAFQIFEGADDVRLHLNGEEVQPDDLGDGSVDADEQLPYEITLRAETGEVAYELAVDGELAQADEGSGEEVEDDSRVQGTLTGDDEHSYRFWGIALVLEIPEGVAGFSVALADDGSTAPDRLPHRLFVYGLGDVVRYRFSVSDSVEFGDAAEEEAAADSEVPADARVDENTVEGHVHAHDGDSLTDDYRFSGSIEFERAEGPVRVRLKPNDEREEDDQE